MERINLQDQHGKLVAEIIILSNRKGLISGMIVRAFFNERQKQEFDEFEEAINNQMFSLLDELETRIAANEYQIVDKNWRITDIQVFNGKDISFRISNEGNNH